MLENSEDRLILSAKISTPKLPKGNSTYSHALKEVEKGHLFISLNVLQFADKVCRLGNLLKSHINNFVTDI